MNNAKPANTLSKLVPGWTDRVDQTDAKSMAAFISSFPEVRLITMDELGVIWSNASEIANAVPPLSVTLDGSGFRVVSALDQSEWYNSGYGEHSRYGNFAVFWSVRGPGNGARPRPCFLFCDKEAVFI